MEMGFVPSKRQSSFFLTKTTLLKSCKTVSKRRIFGKRSSQSRRAPKRHSPSEIRLADQNHGT
jgi:hypothetical protein